MADVIKKKLTPREERVNLYGFYLLCLALSWLVCHGFARASIFWSTGTVFAGNSVLDLAVFAGAFFLLRCGLRVQGRPIRLAAASLGLLLSLLLVAGRCLERHNTISVLFFDEAHVFQLHLFSETLMQLAGCAALFYAALAILFRYSTEGNPKICPYETFWPFTGKHGFFVIWAVLFMCWVPYFLMQYPGVVTYDTNMQFKQALGILPWSNHHPIIDTLWKALFLHLGKAVFGSVQAGVALLSCAQMGYMSAIFAFAVRVLGRMQFHRLVPLAALLWFALYPANGYYSVTHWKDQPFACMLLLLVMALAEIIRQREVFFKKAGHWIWFLGSAAGVMLLRNNGLYVIMLLFPLLLVFLKQVRRQLLCGLVCCVLVFALYKGPVFALLQAEEGSAVEAMSVPLQQMARVARDHWDELRQEEQALYRAMFPTVENIGALYDPRLSDPVKWSFDMEWFAEHKMDFAKTWVQLFPRYGIEYIDAFLSNNFGYWSPEVSYWIIDKGVYSDGLDIERQTLLPKLLDYTNEARWTVQSWNNMKQQAPGIPLLYSIGFHFWLLLSAAVLLLLKRRRAELLALAPVFILWLTCLASPVYAEFRYIYGLFTCLPVLLPLALWLPKRTERCTAPCPSSAQTVPADPLPPAPAV